MFSEDSKKYINLAKWIIGIVSFCILIYLGIRYINVIANSIFWLIQLVLPILIGVIIALVLNIPLHFLEDKLFTKWFPIKSPTLKRNLSIFLSLLCILGVFALALFLVVPELVQAIITLVNIGTNSIEVISELTETIDYSQIPFGNYLEKINIDWISLAAWLQDLLPSFLNDLAIRLPDMIGSSLGSFVDIFLGLIFAIYILSQKAKIMILTVNPFKAVVFVVFLVILQQVEGNVIYPKVVGNRINLPSLWVLAALTVGGNLAGPLGMILGVPAFSAAYNLVNEATKNRETQKKLTEDTYNE